MARTPDADDAVLFDVRLGDLRLGNGIRGYALADGYCVDFENIASALDVAVRIDPGRRHASGWVFDESYLLSIDRDAGSVRHAGQTMTLSPKTITDADGGWCVETRALARWFGIELIPDPLNAVLHVRSDRILPVQEAIERKARAERISGQSEADATADLRRILMPYRLWRTPSADITAGLARADGHRSARYEVFAAGEVAWMSAESRIASNSRGKPSEWRSLFYRNDPDAQLLGPLKATSLSLGDVNSAGTPLVSLNKLGRGIAVSNRPLNQSTRFNAITLRGDLPQGWEVELYRNGELLAVSGREGAGRYLFADIPLLYGSNYFEVVRYGPQGQIRRERIVHEVRGNAVPPGKLRWWASTHQDDRDLITLTRRPNIGGRWRYGGGVEYGLDLRTSLAANIQSLVLDDVRRTYMQSELRRAFGAFGVSVIGAAERKKGKAGQFTVLGSLGGFRLDASAIVNRGLHSEETEETTLRSQRISVERPMRIAGLLLPIHFDLAELKSVSGSRNRIWGGRASYSGRKFSLTTQIRAVQSKAPRETYGPIDTNVSLFASGRLRDVTVRGELDYHWGEGVQTTRLSGEWALDERRQLAAEAAYAWREHRASFRAAYTQQFDRIGISANAGIAGKSGFSGGIELIFSIGRRGGCAKGGLLSSSRIASNGSLAVTVFRDDDADGVQDEGEPILSGVGILVAKQRVPAPEENRSRPSYISGLAWSQPVSVGIDTATLVDPMLDPAEKAVRVVPRKGLTFAVKIAAVPTGIIEGTLTDMDLNAAPHIPVALVDDKGREIARTVSEFDGSFLFERVRYGHYRLKIDAVGVILAGGTRPDAIVLDGQKRDIRMGALKLLRSPVRLSSR